MNLFHRVRGAGLMALLPLLAASAGLHARPTAPLGAPASLSAPLDGDIAAALAAAPHVTSVVESPSPIPGTRFFILQMTQPVDHHHPEAGEFQQTLTLLFRSASAPTVLATTGYGISRRPGQGEPTRLLQANQLTMEHRYFNTSTPAVKDWTKLTIEQSARDEHRIVESIRPLFTGKWLSSGGSKGGMTAIFHRRFFPQDVDATLAYVAPISFGAPDKRYISFVDHRGDATSQKAILDWQQAMLDHRDELLALFKADASNYGQTLDFLGADKALEFAILEAPFTLWQYGDASLAAMVPPATATAQDLYAYLDLVYGGVVFSWCDLVLDYYAAYYYQCKVQLGYPGVQERRLKGLRYAGQDLPAAYPPANAPGRYDYGLSMAEVQAWVLFQGQRIMFIYGENDAWSAGAFLLPPWSAAMGLHKYTVAGGNHGSSLAQLSPSDQQEAYALLSQWMGVPVPSAAPAQPLMKSLVPAPQEFEDTFVMRHPLR